jgi:TPP-dependent pyruvate/acetoin dehydrogenase alpha subunit
MTAKSGVKKAKTNKTGLSDDILLGLYVNLVKTRTTDERLRKLFRQGRYAG